MTSSDGKNTGPGAPHVVWDKSRLHHHHNSSDKTRRNNRPHSRAPQPPAPSQPHSHQPRNNTRPSRPSPSYPFSFPHSPHSHPYPSRRAGAESDLALSFDPMKDLHMWTMWRAAVNGRIVDEARRRGSTGTTTTTTSLPRGASSPTFSNTKTSARTASGAGAEMARGGDPHGSNPYGRALVKTPLDRFIRVGRGSQSIAGVLMDPEGKRPPGGGLGTQQFVFYGVPRVVLDKGKMRPHTSSTTHTPTTVHLRH